MPDMVTMAKALGGGLPSGAIGGSEEVMEVVNNGSVYQVGTYNGNPLTMAAARASLEKVLTPEAYEHLDMLNDRLMAGCDAVLEKYNLPGYTVGISSKGCVTFSPAQDHRLRLVHGQPRRRADRPGLALHDEPRRLHDAGPRRRVDPLGRALDRGRRHVRRRVRGDGSRSDGVGFEVGETVR